MTQYETGTLILNVLLVIANLIILWSNGYFSQKGKNLATKQDIASITDKVESVKIEYLRKIEEYKKDLEVKYSFEPTILKAKISIYELTVDLLKNIVIRKNGLGDEAELNGKIFRDIVKILMTSNTHLKIRTLLSDDITILESENNRIAAYKDQLKKEDTKEYKINFDLIVESLENIQRKIAS